jgi:hypothetical protein
MRIKTTAAGLAAVAIALVGAATPAFANTATDTTSITAGVIAGALSVVAPLDVTSGLSATPGQSDTAPLSGFAVGDLTGLGEGWTVNFVASPMTSGTHVLPTGSLSASSFAAPIAAVSSTPSSDLSITAAGDLDDGTGINVAVATDGEGMGEFVFPASTVGLASPRSAFVGEYGSTVTVTVTQNVE